VCLCGESVFFFSFFFSFPFVTFSRIRGVREAGRNLSAFDRKEPAAPSMP